MKSGNVLVICRSCLTGAAVWIYRGPSKDAERKAYRRACRREIERVRHWTSTMARRKANILQLLNDLTASVSITEGLSQQSRSAARRILSVAKEKTLCNSDFYNHIMEEQRRKGQKENKKNHNYDK